MTDELITDQPPRLEGPPSSSPLLGPRFSSALAFAAELHQRQTRKATGVPYVAHLLAVASLALEHGANEDVAIAALLHDAVEDQGGHATAERIGALFGDEVRRIVMGCTDTEESPKPPWRERKEAYVQHVLTAPVEVKLVSLSDKVHNARSILADHRRVGEEIWGRFRGGKDGTLWYYRALVSAFQAGEHTEGTRRLTEELERLVVELEAAASAGG